MLHINPFPNKILDSPILKEFVDDNLKFGEKGGGGQRLIHAIIFSDKSRTMDLIFQDLRAFSGTDPPPPPDEIQCCAK